MHIATNMECDICVSSCYQNVHSQRHWRCWIKLMDVLCDVFRRRVFASALACSSFEIALDMSKMTSSLAIAFVSGHGLYTCCFSWRRSWHPYGCHSRYGRCPLEHLLRWVSNPNSPSRTSVSISRCLVKHRSEYFWPPVRCHMWHPYIINNM